MDLQTQTQWHRFLTTNYYTFGKPDQPPYTTTMHLENDGTVQGYHQFNERYWKLDGDDLVLLNGNHQPTTRIQLPKTPDSIEANRLSGHYLGGDGKTVHQLIIRPMLAELATELEHLRHDQQAANRAIQDDLGVIHTRLFQKVRTKHRIRVAFILNSVETLPALTPLITCLKADDRFEVKLVALNKMFGFFESLHSLAALQKGLDDLHLDYISLTGDYQKAGAQLYTWQADYIVRQSEWDGDFPKSFSGTNLDWARLIHIPYVITESGLYDPKKAQQSLLTNGYYAHIWRYFTADPLTANEQHDLAASFISPEVFVVAGSMKAQAIVHAAPSWPMPQSTHKKVVWMAHHSIENGWFQMGMFHLVYQQMLTWTKAHPEIDVVYNPHPLLRQKIDDPTVKVISASEYDQFLKAWQALPNTAILVNDSQYPTTAAADVILTDGISSFYEMQLQHKPIVGLMRKDHAKFTPSGEQFMTGVHQVANIESGLVAVMHFLSNPDDLTPTQISNCANWVKYEHPEAFIRDEMVNELK